MQGARADTGQEDRMITIEMNTEISCETETYKEFNRLNGMETHAKQYTELNALNGIETDMERNPDIQVHESPSNIELDYMTVSDKEEEDLVKATEDSAGPAEGGSDTHDEATTGDQVGRTPSHPRP